MTSSLIPLLIGGIVLLIFQVEQRSAFILSATTNSKLIVSNVISPRVSSISNSGFRLHGKKDKKAFKGAPSPPSKSEKQGKADQFDAMTRKFMVTINKPLVK